MSTNIILIYFLKAYGPIKRNRLIETMEHFKVSAKRIRFVNMTLNRISHINVGGGTSEDFVVTSGLREGSPLTKLLFNAI